MIFLETERLYLRDLRPDDFAAYYQLKSDERVMYYLQDIRLHTPKEGRADFDAVLRDAARPDRHFTFLLMQEKAGGRPVGSVGYTVTAVAPPGKWVHGGYFSFPDFWGQGYMTEALRRVLAYAFTEGDVWRFSTGCLTENAGSERVMRKCGLYKEAERPDWEWHDGQLKTRVEYRLLRPEWQAQHPAAE